MLTCRGNAIPTATRGKWCWLLALAAIMSVLPSGSCFAPVFVRPTTDVSLSKSKSTTITTTTTSSLALASSSTTTTRLYMGKGLNKSKNKQADLQRKMELAKQQKLKEQGLDEPEAATTNQQQLSPQEIKERNDRKRFEQMLQRENMNKMLNDYTSDGYLNKQQEEEEITAARSDVDRIFEGDPAPTDCFENLISVTTEKIIAKKGAGRLAPWISKDYNVDSDDYRVIFCDPRKQSDELHQAIKDLYGGLPQDIKDRLFFVNADTPAENRRWLKKNGFLVDGDTVKVEVYCDNEDKDWMRAYTALGEKRWSMTMFVIAKGRVLKLARDVDIYNVARTVINAVKAMKKEQYLD